MKTLITLLLLLSFQFSSAQEVADEPPSDEISTTQEEYNYVTKGYKAQVVDQGGDMKAGYKIEPISKARKIKTVTFEFLLLKRIKGDEYCAIMVYTKSPEKEKIFCIPINNESLMNKYNNELEMMSCQFQREYSQLTSGMLAYVMTEFKKAK